MLCLLVLCLESIEGLRAIVGRFFEVCRQRDLKVNAGNSKEMVLNGEKGVEYYEFLVVRIRLQHMSEF